MNKKLKKKKSKWYLFKIRKVLENNVKLQQISEIIIATFFHFIKESFAISKQLRKINGIKLKLKIKAKIAWCFIFKKRWPVVFGLEKTAIVIKNK